MGNSGLHDQHSRCFWVFTRVVPLLLVICGVVFISSCGKPPIQATANPASEWPMFLHDQQNTGRNDVSIKIPTHVVWSKRFKTDEHSRSVTSPIIYRGKVFCFTSDGFLRALDLRDGSEVWRMSKLHISFTAKITPCGAKGRVVSFDGFSLYATLADKNETIWTNTVVPSASSITSSLISEGDKIFFSTMDGSLNAVSLGNGKFVWRTKILSGSDEDLAPCAAGGKVFVPSNKVLESNNQSIYCVDATTGKVLWNDDKSNALIAGSVTYSSGNIYFGGISGTVFCLDSNDGHRVWSSTLSSSIMATPVVTGDLVVVADESGIVYGLDKQNGQQKWELDNQDDIRTPIVASRDFIIFATSSAFQSNLVFVDYKTGKVVKTLDLSKVSSFSNVGDIGTPVNLVVVKDRIILLTGDNAILCLGN